MLVPAGAVPPAVVDVNAAARSGGNRRDAARRLARSLLATPWAAQVLRVTIDGVGRHEVAGLVISGVKFHEPLDLERFTAQVRELVSRTFAASAVEEVDVWATVPIAVPPGAIVDGDLAVPTSRTVFSCTVRRMDRARFGARLRSGTGIFWEPAFKARLAGGRSTGGGPSPNSPNPIRSS